MLLAILYILFWLGVILVSCVLLGYALQNF